MKKIISFILTTVFLMSLFAIPAYAADTEYDKVLSDVNRTNAEINKMITKSVAEAEKELDNYVANLEILEKGKDVIKLENEISDLNELMYGLDKSMKDYQEKYDKINSELSKKEDQLSKVIQKREDNISELRNNIENMNVELSNVPEGSKKAIKIKSIIDKFEVEIDKSDTEIQELTDKFNKKIDMIIDQLIHDTNRVATAMKNRAADKGFNVVCELVEVDIAGQSILIDPLRILGF